MRQKLLELQQKGIDINKLLMEFLEKREANIVQEKKRLGELKSSVTTTKASRYIPMAIKKVLTEEHGAKCSLMP